MRILHQESNIYYDIIESGGTFKLVSSDNNRSQSFKESYEAIWHAIELIRNASFDLIDDEQLQDAAKQSHVELGAVPRALLTVLRREKMNRTYYDQVFLKLLSQHRAGQEVVSVSNQTNFIIQHEVIHLLKKAVGAKIAVPITSR